MTNQKAQIPCPSCPRKSLKSTLVTLVIMICLLKLSKLESSKTLSTVSATMFGVLLVLSQLRQAPLQMHVWAPFIVDSSLATERSRLHNIKEITSPVQFPSKMNASCSHTMTSRSFTLRSGMAGGCSGLYAGILSLEKL